MTNQAQPGRPPVHDLAAFDLSKRSPEQVALSFARWKAQRKRQADAPRAEPLESSKPAGSDVAAPPEIEDASVKRVSVSRYSTRFSDLLAAGSEPAVWRTAWPPVAALRPPRRTASRGRRLKVMSMLAGAGSVCALACGTLLGLGDWRDPAEVAPQATQIRPQEGSVVGSLAAAASSAPETEWSLVRTIDAALLKAPAPLTPEPPAPAIRTASKAVSVGAGDTPVLPERKEHRIRGGAVRCKAIHSKRCTGADSGGAGGDSGTAGGGLRSAPATRAPRICSSTAAITAAAA